MFRVWCRRNEVGEERCLGSAFPISGDYFRVSRVESGSHYMSTFRPPEFRDSFISEVIKQLIETQVCKIDMQSSILKDRW